MKVNIYNSIDTVTTLEKKEIIDFLHTTLNGYKETWGSIQNAVEYALNPNPAFGGFILYVREQDKIKGVLVMNKTRMKGYIPENHLVYLAVDEEYKNKGIEHTLLEKACRISKGDISIHLKPNDPARKIYENFGFDNIYVEMRYNNN